MEPYPGWGAGGGDARGEEAKLSLSTAGESTQPQRRAAPQSPEALTRTLALGRVPGSGREGRGCLLTRITPRHAGRGEEGAARGGGEEVAVKPAELHPPRHCSSAGSWEQCPARGHGSSPRGRWRWLGGRVSATLALPAGRGRAALRRDGDLATRNATKQCPQEGTAECQRPGAPCSAPAPGGCPASPRLSSPPRRGRRAAGYGSAPIPHPGLSASDLLSGQCG